MRRQQCRHSVQIEKQRAVMNSGGFASSFPLQIAWQRLLRNAFQGEPEFDAGNIASLPQSDAVS